MSNDERGSFELIETIDNLLHGLCQPLTVLQCRLALGQLDGSVGAMREAIEAATAECVRMTRSVETMREALAGIAANPGQSRSEKSVVSGRRTRRAFVKSS